MPKSKVAKGQNKALLYFQNKSILSPIFQKNKPNQTQKCKKYRQKN